MADFNPTDYIKTRLAPESEPALTDSEIAALVDDAKRSDVFGRYPTDTAWIPTYDLPSAIRTGWLLKAAKASASYEFSDSNLTFKRDAIHDHCLKMADEWSKRCTGTIPVLNHQEVIGWTIYPEIYDDAY